MKEQPTALSEQEAAHIYRLRDEIMQQEIEMQRLSAENERIGPLAERVLELKAQRDALLEVVRKHVELHDGDCTCEDCAAIKAVEEA